MGRREGIGSGGRSERQRSRRRRSRRKRASPAQSMRPGLSTRSATAHSPTAIATTTVTLIAFSPLPCHLAPRAQAKEVELARVRSPHSSGTLNYAPELWAHFRTPRTVRVGDVLCVRTRRYPTRLNSSRFEGALESDDEEEQGNLVGGVLAHFKVARVVVEEGDEVLVPGRQAVVNRETTRLLQSGAVNCAVPASWDMGSFPEYRSRHATAVDRALRRSEGWQRGGRAVVLVCGRSGTGKRTLASRYADVLGFHHLSVDAHTLLDAFSDVATEANVARLLRSLDDVSPVVLSLTSVDCLGRNCSCLSSWSSAVGRRVDGREAMIVAVADCPVGDLDSSVRLAFPHQVSLEMPTESERLQILAEIVPAGALSRSALKSLATRTSSMTLEELCYVGECLSSCDSKTCVADEVVSRALKVVSARQSLVAKISQPKVPNVRWEDVGGLEDVKSEIVDTISLPLAHQRLFPQGVRHRSGILLYGPPGTGKTLLAKAVATELSLSFMSVKGPELISMYVGESERNVRKVFESARECSPCVIFFDEIDSLAPKRGAGADSGGVMDRVVSQLLAELDGVQKASSVFVIGATNRPDLVDPALLCPGRFDKMLYLGISADPCSKLKIIRALVNKFNLADDVDLSEISRLCPQRLTGADLYSLCSSAMLCSMRDLISCRDDAGSSRGPLRVHQRHFMEAVTQVVPSVSEQEISYYTSLHSKFKS